LQLPVVVGEGDGEELDPVLDDARSPGLPLVDAVPFSLRGGGDAVELALFACDASERGGGPLVAFDDPAGPVLFVVEVGDVVGEELVEVAHAFHQPGSFLPPRPALIVSTAAAATQRPL